MFRIIVSLIAFFFLVGCSRDINVCRLRKDNIRKDKQLIVQNTVVPTHPLTYCDVVHLAMTHNLDILARSWEYQIQREMVTGEKFGMLPTLTARGNDETRWPQLASSSVDFANPGDVTVPPSVSTVRPSKTWNAQLVWSLLDFGLSYYRSRIAQKKLQIIEQQQERLKQNLALEATKAYWKAIISHQSLNGAKELTRKIEERIVSLETEQKERLISQIDGLDIEKHLAEMKLRLYAFEFDLASAKTELSSLIGIKVGSCFELAEPIFSFSNNCFCIETLEEMALLDRPELRAGDIDEKLQADEVRASIVNMFPNAQLFGGFNQDNNSFLVFNSWWNVGYRATWELLSLPRAFTALEIAQNKKKFSRFTRLSLSIGVMSQVRLAYIEYMQERKHYLLAYQLAMVNDRLVAAAHKELQAGEYKFDDVFKLEIDAFLSYVGMLTAYADMRVALEKLDNAIGRPLFLQKNEM